MHFPSPAEWPTIEVEGQPIPPEGIAEIQMMAGKGSMLPVVGIRLTPSAEFEFEGMVDLKISRPAASLRPLVGSIDRDQLRKMVDASGFREHPADIVLDVILRMAEEHDDDVQLSEESGPTAIQRSSGDYSRGSGTDFGQ